jgi:hypothetical protein
MTGPEAKRFVLIGVTGAGALTAVDQLRKGNVPSVRIGVGVLATGVILMAAAEVAPSIAGGFAMLMLVTSAFVLGGGAWSGISTLTKK